MRGSSWVGAATALVVAAGLPGPAAAQVSLPPLPPIGGQPPSNPPPSGERPPPQQQPAPGPVSQAPGSVTENVNVAQSGFLADDQLVPPLVRRWRVAASPVALLAAGGRVYSIAGGGIVALDQANGRELWKATVAGGVQGAAYDQGRVFVSTFDDLHAFDAASGAFLWKQHLENVAFAGNPVASDGVVYVTHGQGGGTLHAFRAEDGGAMWTKGAPGGSTAPALDSERIYLAGACANALAYRRPGGEDAWNHRTGCSGGADVTPALHDGRLYVPEEEYTGSRWLDPPILDAATGGDAGRFVGSRPVFVDGLALHRRNDRVVAAETASGRQAWQLKGTTGPMLAVGHDVYAMQGRVVKALDSESGRVLWSQTLGGSESSETRQALLAAAPGLLLVAREGRLEAYESALKPAPRGVEVGLYADEVVSGSRAVVAGVVGTELRADRPQAAIETARWHAGGFKRALSVKAARDGGFAGRVRVVRNTRVRATAAGVASAPVTVYAWPSLKLGRARPFGRYGVRYSVVLRAAATRLGGRTFAIYLDRHKTKGLRLLDTAQLNGGRTARALVSYQDRPPYDKRDLIWYCIRGQLSLELGSPSPLTKRCGRPTLPEPG